MAAVSPSRFVPYGFARSHSVLVTGQSGDAIEVWIGDRTTPGALAELTRNLPYRIVTIKKPEAELAGAISRAYSQQEGSAASVVDEVESDLDLSRLMQDIPKIEDLLETEDDAPIIRMINALLTQASRDGASDIHIEPFEGYSVVRFRVDGTLRDVVRPRRELHAALICHKMAALHCALVVSLWTFACQRCLLAMENVPYCVCWIKKQVD
jgi:general secretion pathway protein E